MSTTSIDDIVNFHIEHENDFGFISSENRENGLTIYDYKIRMKQIEAMILPLLSNFHSTADNPNIYWPNRKEELEEKIKEFLKLTRD